MQISRAERGERKEGFDCEKAESRAVSQTLDGAALTDLRGLI